jgi:hypothetical protein
MTVGRSPQGPSGRSASGRAPSGPMKGRTRPAGPRGVAVRLKDDRQARDCHSESRSNRPAPRTACHSARRAGSLRNRSRFRSSRHCMSRRAMGASALSAVPAAWSSAMPRWR